MQLLSRASIQVVFSMVCSSEGGLLTVISPKEKKKPIRSDERGSRLARGLSYNIPISDSNGKCGGSCSEFGAILTLIFQSLHRQSSIRHPSIIFSPLSADVTQLDDTFLPIFLLHVGFSFFRSSRLFNRTLHSK
jgi:hypothetical protein